MKQCPNCNASVADDHVFCMECGTRIESEPAPTRQPEAETEPVQHEEMISVENHIMWNVQPGQVARLITEKEYLQYSDAAGLIINNGARILVRRDADELTMLSSGVYSFKEPRQPADASQEEKKQGFIRNLINSANGTIRKDEKPVICSILLVRDGDFPVIFGGPESTGEAFVPMNVSAANLDVHVGVSAMIRIASMQVFSANYMMDRTGMTTGELVKLVAPKVEKTIREALAGVTVSESGLPESVREDIQARLKALTPKLGGVEISSVEEVRIGNEALDRFRALNSELYLTGRELEYLERTNEFKNRLTAAQNAQQVNEARNDLELYKRLNQINQDKLLAEDELEKFYMVLSREKKIREAHNEEEIAAAMAEIEKTGLIRAEDLNRLKDEIRCQEHKRGHAFRMMQKKDEIELASLQREYELRVRDEDYQFEKRKKDDEFDRFKELERIRREQEAAEHERNMAALREMQQAKLEKMRLSRELTPEQLMALSVENLSPEAAAKLADSLGRNREAEYLERLTQARVEDMKEMVRIATASAAPAAVPAPQPQHASIFCPSCGSRNNAEAKFCMTCGTSMNQ